MRVVVEDFLICGQHVCSKCGVVVCGIMQSYSWVPTFREKVTTMCRLKHHCQILPNCKWIKSITIRVVNISSLYYNISSLVLWYEVA